MSYEEKFKRVKKSLITFVKEEIISRYNYCNEFHMWSYSAIKDAYISKFKDEFARYMNKDIESHLWLAGYNIAFAVQTFIATNPNYTLKKLVTFVETFLTLQLDDFDNWCDDIRMKMYEESSDYERENQPDGNPEN